MFKRILVATDFEDGLDRLALCLHSLQAGGATAVGFVNALPWDESQMGGQPRSMEPQVAAAEARFQARLKTNPDQTNPSQTAEIMVRVGKPAEVIQKAIATFRPDLLVLGMPTRSLLAEKVFGSTTMGLLPQIKVPVLVIRPQLIAALTLEELQLRARYLFHYLMVPTDLGAKNPQSLVQRVRGLLEQDAAHQCESVHLVYVQDPAGRHPQPPPAPGQEVPTAVQAQLTSLAKELGEGLESVVEITTEVRVGPPVKEILAAAQEHDTTAIATSSRNTGRIWEWTVPSITGDLMRRSWHSVLFFPPA